ncbi:MAG: sugar transferase [Fibrobacterales bacterium]|nr:sugar transferase [Fibrobacterales bacterium]MBP5189042.1 sugar transferase [Fibrobacterales bacterium]
MKEELKRIFGLDTSDSFVYSPGLFDMRLKEELLRSHRQQIPFLYLQIPTKDFNALGMERRADATRAWKIAVLTLFSFTTPVDVKGFLDRDTGIGLIMINRTEEDVVRVVEAIRRNLIEAGLYSQIKLNPRKPLFLVYYCPVQKESERIRTEGHLARLNEQLAGWFRIEEYRYSRLWNNGWNRWFMDWIKRAIDFTGALFGLVLLSPVLLATAVAVKLTSKGPVFFGQTRVGKDGDLFTMWKFRSMVVDAEQRKAELIRAGLNEEGDGPTFKMKRDPRLTPIGRFIRKYSIDELPQLWNVLVGDMAIVGPRPPIPSEVMEYLPWHKMRLSVKPGLTCHWQVSGRSNIGFADWMRLDNDYVRHGSLKTDMELIGRTFKAVVKGDGAY